MAKLKVEIEKPKSLAYRVFLRFARVFVLAGIAQVGVVLVANPLTELSLKSLETWVAMLITAFIAGGLAGLDKGIRG